MPIRALFVGGTIDNAELDLDDDEAPVHYPPETGSGQSRYRVHSIGRSGDTVAYAVYGAPEMSPGEVSRVSEERQYARRFDATESTVD